MFSGEEVLFEDQGVSILRLRWPCSHFKLGFFPSGGRGRGKTASYFMLRNP